MNQDSEDLISHAGNIVDQDRPYILAYYDEQTETVTVVTGGPRVIQVGLVQCMAEFIGPRIAFDDDEE